MIRKALKAQSHPIHKVWMVGFEPDKKDKELNYKIILESTRHAFWDSSREWKVRKASLQREYLHPHGVLSDYKTESSMITLRLQLKRTQSYWELLYLLPLVITAALSAGGLIIPSNFFYIFSSTPTLTGRFCEDHKSLNQFLRDPFAESTVYFM